MTREMTVEDLVQDAATIRRLAGLCLRRAPLAQRIRLLGVRVGSLEEGAPPPEDAGAVQPAAALRGVTPDLFDGI